MTTNVLCFGVPILILALYLFIVLANWDAHRDIPRGKRKPKHE